MQENGMIYCIAGLIKEPLFIQAQGKDSGGIYGKYNKISRGISL